MIELVAAARIVRGKLALLPPGDGFPFELGRQTLACPCGEGVGLEIRNVCHRSVQIPDLRSAVSERFVPIPV